MLVLALVRHNGDPERGDRQRGRAVLIRRLPPGLSLLKGDKMAQTYKQRIFKDVEAILDKYPRAKVSDVIFALEAVAEGLWRALPAPKKGRKVLERTKRYRIA